MKFEEEQKDRFMELELCD